MFHPDLMRVEQERWQRGLWLSCENHPSIYRCLHAFERLRGSWRSFRYEAQQERAEFLIQGQLAGEAQPFRVGVSGSEALAQSTLALIFASQGTIEKVPHRAENLDLTLGLAHPWQKPQALQEILPIWVTAALPCREPESILAAASKDFRRAFRAVEAKKLRLSLHHDVETWQAWYETMMVPLAQLRHGQTAAIPSFAEIWQLAPKGVLFQVHAEEGPVAGGILVFDRKFSSIELVRICVKSEFIQQPKFYKELNVYLDYVGLNYAYQVGAKRYSLGSTLVRLDSGLIRYKKSWGCDFVVDPHMPRYCLSFKDSVTQLRIMNKLLIAAPSLSDSDHETEPVLLSEPALVLASEGSSKRKYLHPGFLAAIPELESLIHLDVLKILVL